MSGFTSEALEKKLAHLENSQQSIQTLSLWLIHHRKHHKIIVDVWSKELRKAAKQSKKLTFMYLANDVIQNSRKKPEGPEYAKEFATVLKRALEDIAKDCDDKTWGGMYRTLTVWQERAIYDEAQISLWKKALGPHRSLPALTESKSSLKSKSSRASGKSKRSDNEKDQSDKKQKLAKPSSNTKSSVVVRAPTTIKTIAKPAIDPIPAPQPGVIIDPDTLIKALQELESSASSDVQIREKIASFPPEVTDVSLLDKIRDKDSADKLSRQVDVLSSMLSEYNGRLVQELQDRKQVSVMLSTYIKNQQDQLTLSEQKINEYKDKLKRVTQVRSELKSHLQNLPDLSLLPSVTGGLAPLPSAGDLFNAAAARAMGYVKHPSSMGSTSSASPSTSSPADYETLLHTPNSSM
jgi:regulator of Ty1 transposition protein 103